MKSSARPMVLAAVALAVSCGDSGPAGPGAAGNSLVFTRADQSVISFAAGAPLFVWCGPWEQGQVATPSLQVLFGGPLANAAHWQLRVVIADVSIGTPLAFPNNFIWNQPKAVDLFVGDPPNELSTQDGRSAGTITFQQLNCASGGEVEFSVDAVIGSEFSNGASVGVKGTFHAVIGQPPS